MYAVSLIEGKEEADKAPQDEQGEGNGQRCAQCEDSFIEK
jgi:hypothetical protein